MLTLGVAVATAVGASDDSFGSFHAPIAASDRAPNKVTGRVVAAEHDALDATTVDVADRDTFVSGRRHSYDAGRQRKQAKQAQNQYQNFPIHWDSVPFLSGQSRAVRIFCLKTVSHGFSGFVIRTSRWGRPIDASQCLVRR